MAYNNYTKSNDYGTGYDYRGIPVASSPDRSNSAAEAAAYKAAKKGEISAREFNKLIDNMKYPNNPSRAAAYDRIVSGKESMMDAMISDAKASPTVKDVASDVDMIVGTDLSGKLSSEKTADRPIGTTGYTGYGGSYSTSSAKGTSNSYLDMLHAEQERVWNREDTAYQRTVRDLQAAGLNPVLAVNHGVSASGGSGSSDSQVVGAIADLAGMAISGLSETAKGISTIAAMDSKNNFFQNLSSYVTKNSGTIRNLVNTASTIARLLK